MGLRFNTKMLSQFEPCPNCKMWIQKDGGCPHMKCEKCKYEFCWHCLGSYKGYRHENEWICPVTTGARITLNVLLVTVVVLKLMPNILSYIYWIFAVILGDISVFLAAIMMLSFNEPGFIKSIF